MPWVTPVNLAYNPRTLWFDPHGLTPQKDQAVIVETMRGIEFGMTADENIEIDEHQLKSLRSPLRPLLRIANDDDIQRAHELEERNREALPIFKEMAATYAPDMHPISVEFLFDGDKAVFYFEAAQRVDFRDLVRRLASYFHVRIDMRQVGVREEARILGGLGHCGQELCCKRMGGVRRQVSMRMAKEQDLSLNPQKISGMCGRLMCCLRYEYEAYRDFKNRAPYFESFVVTPEGPAQVVEFDVPREIVYLQIGEEKPVKIPLADFDPPREGTTRPSVVGQEAWDEAHAAESIDLNTERLSFLASRLTSSDTVAPGGRSQENAGDAGKRGRPLRSGSKSKDDIDARGRKSSQSRGHAHRGNVQSGRRVYDSSAQHHRRGKKRYSSYGERYDAQSKGLRNRHAAPDEVRKPRRRSTKISADGVASVKGAVTDTSIRQTQRSSSSAPPNVSRETDHRRLRRRSHKTDATTNKRKQQEGE